MRGRLHALDDTPGELHAKSYLESGMHAMVWECNSMRMEHWGRLYEWEKKKGTKQHA